MFRAESSLRLGVGSTRRGLRAATLGSLGGVASSLSMVAAGSASVLWTWWRENAALTTDGLHCQIFDTPYVMIVKLLSGSRTHWIPFDSRSQSALGSPLHLGPFSLGWSPSKCNLKRGSALKGDQLYLVSKYVQTVSISRVSIREMRKFISIQVLGTFFH